MNTNTATALRLALQGQSPGLAPESVAAIQSCDLPTLAALAEVHRAAPWLSAAVAGQPALAGLPGVELIHQAGARQTFHALRLYGELCRLVAELNAAGAPVVVLKGPVVAQHYYPDPSLRPYGDIDILVHERDLKHVSMLLLARGYHEKNGADDHAGERIHECHGIFQRIFINDQTGMIVEVHCDHLQIGLEPVGMDQIWESSVPLSVGQGSAGALEDHDLFVQLCVHLQRHGYERLIWFKDLDLIVRRDSLDWRSVSRRAEEQGCLGAVAYALSLLPGMLGTPLPAGARAIARSQGRASRALYSGMWPEGRVRRLEPQQQWRFRRLVQFAPETGFFRGGLPSLLVSGRRRDKTRVLVAGLRRKFARN